MHDLDTVDDGVWLHLPRMLAPEAAGEWDLVIGHYLGVDHAGHLGSVETPTMMRKLEQMDSQMVQVTQIHTPMNESPHSRYRPDLTPQNQPF